MDRPDRPELERLNLEGVDRAEALRAAIQVGLDDFAAGRYREFGSFDEMDDFLRQETERILAEQSE